VGMEPTTVDINRFARSRTRENSRPMQCRTINSPLPNEIKEIHTNKKIQITAETPALGWEEAARPLRVPGAR
jgi:hypothetical protein